MMAYTLRYQNELRNQARTTSAISSSRRFNPIRLNWLRHSSSGCPGKLDINKFEDGCEVAVKALVEAEAQKHAGA